MKLKYLVVIGMLAALPAQAKTVKLGWDANTDPVAGYKLYMWTNGNATGTATEKDCGNVTVCEIDIPVATPVSFAVTAYNSGGLESDFSNIVQYWEMQGTPISLTPLGPGQGYDLAWLEGPGFVKGYQVVQGLGYQNQVAWNQTNIVTGYTNNEIHVSRLQQGTNYFRVRPIFAGDPDYTSDYSGLASVAPPRAPGLRIIPPSENVLSKVQ